MIFYLCQLGHIPANFKIPGWEYNKGSMIYSRIESFRGFTSDYSQKSRGNQYTLKRSYVVYDIRTDIIHGSYRKSMTYTMYMKHIDSVVINRKRYSDIKIVTYSYELLDGTIKTQIGIEIPDKYFRKERIKSLLKFLNK